MFARGIKVLLTSGAVIGGIGAISCSAPLAFANESKDCPSSLLKGPPSVKWDRNWDFMDPSTYVKPNATDEEVSIYELKHIFFVAAVYP